MKRIITSLLFLLFSCFAFSENIQIKAAGEFANIDVQEQNEILGKILKGDRDAIELVVKDPRNYNPVVLYGLSASLFNNGEKDDAAFWFYVGQLRGRSDANKSLDISARQAIAMLNQRFGVAINQYVMQDLPKLKEIVAKAVSFDEKTARNYDPRWISLHGMDVFLKKEKIAFEPESKWEEINNKTRAEYYDGFKKAIKNFEQQG
ncbi:hypothetical protein [Endozoicomonas sp.]|uniref:hypothetical protein n=1 Tax=Endozoicomonas sp. TaxID=1892382 RepID=UPI003AF85966